MTWENILKEEVTYDAEPFMKQFRKINDYINGLKGEELTMKNILQLEAMLRDLVNDYKTRDGKAHSIAFEREVKE
jgi:hypothetical protein